MRELRLRERVVLDPIVDRLERCTVKPVEPLPAAVADPDSAHSAQMLRDNARGIAGSERVRPPRAALR
jgi:hypothetical protein